MIDDSVLLQTFESAPSPYANRPNAGEAVAGIRPPRERRIRYGRSAKDEHDWEWAAAELYRWERETPEKLATAMMPTGRAPFTTAAPSDEQVDFWLSQLILPDGTLNRPALDELLLTASPEEVHGLAQAMRKRRAAPPDGTNVAGVFPSTAALSKPMSTAVSPAPPAEEGY